MTDVRGSLKRHALHAQRKEVEVTQTCHHSALAKTAGTVVLGKLFQRLKRLFRKIDVLDR